MGPGGSFDLELVDQRPGFVAFRVTGKGARKTFKYEPGGHRWQRIPDNEKRGRVHTSTITVAVLLEPTRAEVRLVESELDIKVTRSGGPGGQHANKTSSAVVITHGPTGIRVRVETTSSQHRNKELARAILAAKLLALSEAAAAGGRNGKRRSQVGTGMRADKIRTIAVQRGTVTDHRTGKKMPVRKYLRGEIERLWPKK